MIEKVSYEKYVEVLRKNKSNYPMDKRWRVEEKRHDSHYIIEGNTFALENDGTIAGVCKRAGSSMSGREIISEAIKAGGNKANAFGEKLYNIYTQCGFKPVVRVKFDIEKAPEGCTGKDELILYAYTGKNTELDYNEFLKITEPFESFETAQKYRKWIME